MSITVEQYIEDMPDDEGLKARLRVLNAALVRNPTAEAFQELMDATWDKDKGGVIEGVTRNMRGRMVEHYASLRIDGILKQTDLKAKFQLCDFRIGNRKVDEFEFDHVIRSANDERPRVAVECKTWLDNNMFFGPATKFYIVKKRLPGVRCYLLVGNDNKHDYLVQKFPEVAEWLDGLYALGSEPETAAFLEALGKCLR